MLLVNEDLPQFVHVLTFSTKALNLVISRWFLAEYGEEMHQNLYRTFCIMLVDICSGNVSKIPSEMLFQGDS